MRIEIKSDDMSGARGAYVYCNGKKIQTRGGGMFPYDFDDNDLLDLLGPRRFEQYERGKHIFDLTKQEIFEGTNDIRFFKP